MCFMRPSQAYAFNCLFALPTTCSPAHLLGTTPVTCSCACTCLCLPAHQSVHSTCRNRHNIYNLPSEATQRHPTAQAGVLVASLEGWPPKLEPPPPPHCWPPLPPRAGLEPATPQPPPPGGGAVLNISHLHICGRRLAPAPPSQLSPCAATQLAPPHPQRHQKAGQNPGPLEPVPRDFGLLMVGQGRHGGRQGLVPGRILA